MLFSVIIPAYNCINTLQNTVGSVLNSGLYDFEIVMIDDGSTDGTSELCDSLGTENSKIRCIHQGNAGVSIARNRGIEAARGDYVLFFDSDDTVDTGILKHAAELVKQTKPDMLIFGLSFDYYFRGKLYRRDELVYSKERLLNQKQWCAEFMELYACNALSPVWNKFIRRSILTDNQILFCKDLIEMEDFLFVVHCMNHCKSIYVLPEAIYRYRQPEDERSTFYRLLRIPSLTAYMQPFETGMEELVSTFSLTGDIAANIRNVVAQIYTSLFYEQIHFGDIEEIERASNDMLTGKYAEVIRTANRMLFELLEQKHYRQVWIQNAKVRLKHWLAVRIKYIKSCRRI